MENVPQALLWTNTLNQLSGRQSSGCLWPMKERKAVEAEVPWRGLEPIIPACKSQTDLSPTGWLLLGKLLTLSVLWFQHLKTRA